MPRRRVSDGFGGRHCWLALVAVLLSGGVDRGRLPGGLARALPAGPGRPCLAPLLHLRAGSRRPTPGWPTGWTSSGTLARGVAGDPKQAGPTLTVIEGRWPGKRAVRLDRDFLAAEAWAGRRQAADRRRLAPHPRDGIDPRRFGAHRGHVVVGRKRLLGRLANHAALSRRRAGVGDRTAEALFGDRNPRAAPDRPRMAPRRRHLGRPSDATVRGRTAIVRRRLLRRLHAAGRRWGVSHRVCGLRLGIPASGRGRSGGLQAGAILSRSPPPCPLLRPAFRAALGAFYHGTAEG